MTFCAEGAEKIFLRALLFLVQEAIATHGATDFGRRVEQRWPYYFLCRRLIREHQGGWVVAADGEEEEGRKEGKKEGWETRAST